MKTTAALTAQPKAWVLQELRAPGGGQGALGTGGSVGLTCGVRGSWKRRVPANQPAHFQALCRLSHFSVTWGSLPPAALDLARLLAAAALARPSHRGWDRALPGSAWAGAEALAPERTNRLQVPKDQR